MKRALVILVFCIALVACERSFDITRQVGDNAVWMSFIPSNDYDTTFFIVQGTTPLAGTTDPLKTNGETVEVRVNGRSLVMKKDGRRSVPDRVQFYATDHVFSPGDMVEASAMVPGAGHVYASCEVPEAFPDYTWKARLVPRSSPTSFTMIVDLDYDDPGDGGYYGAAVMQYYEEDSQWENYDAETGEKYWGEIYHTTHTGSLAPSGLANVDDLLSAQGEAPVSVSPKHFNTLSGSYPRVQIWRDPPFTVPSDRHRHMTIAARCSEQPAHTDYTGGNTDGWTEYRYKYRIVLYRFSESCYNYLKAQYNVSNNDFSSLGLAPPSFVYTNVNGGSGVCGAYIVISSDWIELEK